jgi:hypothetical protein
MDHNLANRAFAFKSPPPGVGADDQHTRAERQQVQDILAHERQRLTVEQSLLRHNVKPKKAA